MMLISKLSTFRTKYTKNLFNANKITFEKFCVVLQNFSPNKAQLELLLVTFFNSICNDV